MRLARFAHRGSTLCRPSIAGKRVTEQEDGRFRVEVKTAWRDGTTAAFLSPTNLTARMAALILLPGKLTIRHWLGSAAKRPCERFKLAFATQPKELCKYGLDSSCLLGGSQARGLPADSPLRAAPK